MILWRSKQKRHSVSLLLQSCTKNALFCTCNQHVQACSLVQEVVFPIQYPIDLLQVSNHIQLVRVLPKLELLQALLGGYLDGGCGNSDFTVH